MGKKKPVEIRIKLNDQAVEALLDMFGEPPEAPGVPTPSVQEWLNACQRGQIDRLIEKSRQRRGKTLVKQTEGDTAEGYRQKANAAQAAHSKAQRIKATEADKKIIAARRQKEAELRAKNLETKRLSAEAQTGGPVKTVARPVSPAAKMVTTASTVTATAPTPTPAPAESSPEAEPVKAAPTPTSKPARRTQKPSFGK